MGEAPEVPEVPTLEAPEVPAAAPPGGTTVAFGTILGFETAWGFFLLGVEEGDEATEE
jgi:hypothetical protein